MPKAVNTSIKELLSTNIQCGRILLFFLYIHSVHSFVPSPKSFYFPPTLDQVFENFWCGCIISFFSISYGKYNSYLTAHWIGGSWSIQEHDSQNIDVPHSIDTSEECT